MMTLYGIYLTRQRRQTLCIHEHRSRYRGEPLWNRLPGRQDAAGYLLSQWSAQAFQSYPSLGHQGGKHCTACHRQGMQASSQCWEASCHGCCGDPDAANKLRPSWMHATSLHCGNCVTRCHLTNTSWVYIWTSIPFFLFLTLVGTNNKLATSKSNAHVLALEFMQGSIAVILQFAVNLLRHSDDSVRQVFWSAESLQGKDCYSISSN